jgi:sugar phosphate isomerase/epimerase
VIRGLASTGLVTRFPDAPDHGAIAEWCPRLDVDGLELSISRVWEAARVEHDLHAAGLRFQTAHLDKRIGAELLEDAAAALAQFETGSPLENVRRAVETDDRCRITLDTEFLAHHGQVDAALADDELWERVAHLHVKDYAGTLRDAANTRRYLIPGDGTIDWDRVFGTLQERSYDGALTLEVSSVTAAGTVDEQRFRAAESWLRERPWLLSV